MLKITTRGAVQSEYCDFRHENLLKYWIYVNLNFFKLKYFIENRAEIFHQTFTSIFCDIAYKQGKFI